MPEELLAEEMEATIDRGADTFHELALYRSGRHHVEAEARVVQALPPQDVEALFIQHCGDRLELLIRCSLCIGIPGCWR